MKKNTETKRRKPSLRETGRRSLALLLSLLMLAGTWPAGLAAYADEETPSEPAAASTTSLRYSVVVMGDPISPAPTFTLCADGVATDKTATTADSTETVGAFTKQTCTFSDLPVNGESETAITYSVTASAADGYALFFKDTNTYTTPTLYTADTRPTGSADFIYVARGSVSGTAATDDAGGSFSGLTLSAAPAETNAYAAAANTDVTPAFTITDSDKGTGTWSVGGLLLYDPSTGSELVYKTTAALDGYTASYDNSAVEAYKAATDAAYAGGTITMTKVESTPTEPETKNTEAETPVLTGTEPETSNTVTVTNTTYNYGVGDVTVFKLSADASVTVGSSEAVPVKAGDTFSVPVNSSYTVTYTGTSIDVSFAGVKEGDNAVACSLFGESTRTVTGTGTAAFVSQEPANNISLELHWEDGAADAKPDLSGLLSLEYSTDSGSTWVPLAAGDLGYTALPTIPTESDTSNASVWVYSFDKELFTCIEVEGVVVQNAVSYRLAETTPPDGYAASYDAEHPEYLVNTKKNLYTATVKWADGSNKYTTREAIETWLSKLTASKSSTNETAAVQLTTTDSTAEGYITVTDNGDNTWTLSMPNALGYDASDFPYSYCLTETTVPIAENANVTTDTTYAPTYLNEGNYSSKTAALYTGGTVTNLLKNTTAYTAKKVWLDDGEPNTIAARPTAALQLFRYPDNGTANYTTASPVAGVSFDPIDNTVKENTAITIVPKGEPSLLMFNEDGYKYVYYTKETLSGGTNTYKQVFKNNNDLTGTPVTAANGGEKFLFNGGELDNTITGTVDLSATKTWVAAARQDVDAQVTMSVSQTDPSTNTTTTLTSLNQTLTGFGTENPSKTADFTGLPKYNDNGIAYIYGVWENGLKTKVGNDYVAATSKTVSGTTYFITADGYRYKQYKAQGENGTTVTNTLVGNAQVVINKTFTNGLLASPTTLTYTVYQNGTAIGTVTKEYTGHTDDAKYEPGPITITKYEDLDANSYGTKSGLLPRYDTSGAQYKYTVSETGIDPANTYGTTTNNSMSEGSYTDNDSADGANYTSGEKYAQATADISNYKPGEGMTITVHKVWNDDGDTMYHQDVHVALQYTADGATWATVATGTISTSTDYVYIGVPTDNQAAYTAWIEAKKPATGTGVFRVVETALGATSQYSVVADGDSSITATSGHKTGNSFVSTPNQNYDVSPVADVTGNYDFTVTNTRVGVEQIVLTKTWVDGDNAKSTRPKSVTFTVTASENVFESNSGATDGRKYVDAKTLTYDISAASSWALTTGWYPKYNSTTGALITYTIAETKMNYSGTDYSGQYAKSSEHTGYTVGEHHTADEDVYAFKNTLSSTVTPLMNKYWKDNGDDATIAACPDIYPVLFRSYTDSTGTHYEKMAYQDRSWNTEVKTKNWWQCKFVSQPRYTDDGYEYTYYVGEEFASADTNDYVCSGGYADAPTEDGSFTEEAANTDQLKMAVTGLDKDYYVARLNNESGAAGTIVNKPSAMRTVSGTKVWSNLPAGFKKTYLPAVTFALYRYKSTDVNKTLEAVTANGNAVTATLASGASAFAFTNPEDSSGKFPRYDANGVLYTYIVKETAPTDIGLSYSLANDTTNGLVATNAFNTDQKYGITFTKTWTGVPTGAAQKPSTTLTLVRYLTSDAAGTSIINGTSEIVDSTPTGDGVAYNTTSKNTTLTYTSATQTVNWTNLAYYGPNGNPYQYRVQESGVPDGYVVYNAAGTTVVTATSGIYEATVTGTFNETTKSGTAGLTNKYGDVLGSLTVKKNWVGDSTYAISPRPTSVTLTLKRKTTNIADATVSDYSSIVLNKSNNWTTEISGLEVYAPNGEQYTYSVAETTPSGYASTSSGVTLTAGTTPTTLTVTNTAGTASLTVKKAWQYKDNTTAPSADQLKFAAAMSAVPTSITFGILYSTNATSGWQILKDKDNNAVTKIITQKDGIYGSVNLTDLPAYAIVNGTSAKIYYKAYEASLTYADGTTVSRSASDYTDSTNFGNIQSAATITTADNADFNNTTAVTNTIPMKAITITKTWDDENNRDGLRKGLTFTVTRDTTQSATVTLSSTNADKTDANKWSTTVYVPVYKNGSTDQSSYTVEETNGVNAEYTKSSGTDGSNYDSGNSVTLDTTGTSAYFKNTEQTIENFSITPTKVWAYNGTTYNDSIPDWLQSYLQLNGKKLTFELQYRVGDTGDWAKVTEAGDFAGITADHDATITPATGAIEVTSWTGLPRHVKTGKVETQQTYYYRVIEMLTAEQGNVFSASYATSKDGNTWVSTNDINGGDKTITNATARVTNTLNLTSLAIAKSWVDSSNAYNTRPDSITYTLQYSTDGTTWSPVLTDWSTQSVTATSANSYGVTISTLPEYQSDGKTLYQYKAEETSLNYTGNVTVAPGSGQIYNSTTSDGKTFTNTLGTTSFTVNKVWGSDPLNIGGDVASITVKLQSSTDNTNWADVKDANGKTKTWTITKTEPDSNAKTWTDLPTRDPNDKAYSYRAIETAINLTTAAGGSTITAVPNATDPTSGTVGGYTYSSQQNAATETTPASTTITNSVNTTIKPGTGEGSTSLTATKVWADSNNANSTRPTSVKFHLYQSGTLLNAATYDRTLSAPDWKTSWTDLPAKNAAGTAYTYTVTEDAVPGYTTAITGTMAVGYTVTNTPTTVTLSKVDADNAALTGAAFTVTPESGKAFADNTTLKTMSGSATLTGQLIVGVKYTFTETTTPAGFITMAPFTVTVGADGKLTFDGTHTDAALDTAATTITAMNSPNRFIVTKTTNESYPLAGTTFSLTRADTGAAVDSWTISASSPTNNPYTLTGKLTAGVVYKLTETQPAPGYQADAPIYLKMDAAGQLRTDTAESGKFETTVSGNALSINNGKNSFSLQKLGADDKALDGASFEISGTFQDETEKKTITGTLTTLTGALKAGNTYTITETAAPDGYAAAKPFQVKMKTDGTLEAVGTLPDVVFLNNSTVTVKDAQTVLTVVKTNGSTKLKGATLTLTGTFAGGSTGTTKTWTSTETDPVEDAGLFTGKLVTGSEYTLAETKQPDGYVLSKLTDSYKDAKLTENGEMTLRLDPYGQLSYESTADGGWTQLAGNAVTVRDTPVAVPVSDPTASLTIRKTDSGSGAALAGVVFTLAGKTKDGVARSWTAAATDANGKTAFANVPLGSYTLTEARLAGYAVPHSFTVTVTASGDDAALAVTDNSTGKAVSLNTDGSCPITNTRTDSSLVFTKKVTGYESGYAANATPIPLADVHFGLYTDAACTTAYAADPEGVSDDNGTVRFSKLPAGTYYVREKSATSNIVASAAVYSVTVDSYGGVSQLTPLSGGAETDTLVNDVLRGSFTFRKVDALDNSKYLPNSTYNLYRLNTDGAVAEAYAEGTAVVSGRLSLRSSLKKLAGALTAQLFAADTDSMTLVASAVTGADGTLTFSGLLTDVTYYLKEVKAPDGSQVSAEPVSFKLEPTTAADGRPATKVVALDTGSGTVKQNENGELEWQEPPTIVSIKKLDADGSELGGAVLRITDEQGNVVVSDFTSSAKAAKQLTGILKGGARYTLTEVSAPAGYELAAPVTFTVTASEVGPSQKDIKNSIQDVLMYDLKPGQTDKDVKPPKDVPDDTGGNSGGSNGGAGDRRDNGSPAGAANGGPQTDDPSRPQLWFLLLIASGLAEAALLPARRHKKRGPAAESPQTTDRL